MKKYTSYVVIIFTIFTLVGCSNKQYENVKEKDVFDMKIATNVVEKYFHYLELDKYKDAGDMLIGKAKTDTKDVKPSDLKLRGHRISGIMESGGEGNFKIDVMKSNISKSETQILEYRITVSKSGMEYKISDVNSVLMKEVFQSFDQLRLRKENQVDNVLVTNMDGIMGYTYTKGDNGKLVSEMVPKKHFGICALNYSGDTLAITTTDKNCFLGLVILEDTMQTQGQPTDQEKGGEQGGGAGQSTKMIKEKPIGKQLIPCDILKDTIIENMLFSQNDKLLVIQYKKGNDRCIKVFDKENGDQITTIFEEEYPLSKVDVVFKDFQKDKMRYNVVGKGKEDKSNQYVGEWELDLKNYKISKIKK
ncbi:hypothetical protein IRP63_13140 [Clostridium botulinum]|uniref:Lipoprotein n=1 Tax=Clostridium botulinum C/D str. DC5 TaxID=1443128 RepID=A0A0A0I6U1_CLOBO|nr:hypothetical protein [Clostridium botulinum]KEI00709.1 hypothetical protein Z952_00385 [Clostridium botulinum C/D str. BKT75002]KEI08455.1 hypothetical protein Z954_01245 [Clostridium botulinum C/D str. BKT2873]KGM96031.1 hypothetical protein Z955_13570 [Clostridium botulinum C/D str. DC5]KGM96714.1 hypothetical protein Z956_02365 [Clostridium botulinum D str. CCUG 7971]KOC51280.1 hypothetical protein ADU88_00240 [Clostridium botulinum]